MYRIKPVLGDHLLLAQSDKSVERQALGDMKGATGRDSVKNKKQRPLRGQTRIIMGNVYYIEYNFENCSEETVEIVDASLRGGCYCGWTQALERDATWVERKMRTLQLEAR